MNKPTYDSRVEPFISVIPMKVVQDVDLAHLDLQLIVFLIFFDDLRSDWTCFFFYIMVDFFYWEYQLNLYMFVFKGKSFAKWCQWNILPTNEGAFLWEIRPLQIRFHLARPKDRKTC